MAAAVAHALSEAGVSVSVIAAEPSYTDASIDAPREEISGHLKVTRIRMGKSRGRSTMATRLLGYLRFLVGAAFHSARIKLEAERMVVMTFHNPPLIPLIGAWLARRHRAQFVYMPQDIHPDIVVEAGWPHLPGFVIWAWARFSRAMFQRADRVVVLGRGMRETLLEKGWVSPQDVVVIPPWAEPELPPMSRDSDLLAELGISESSLIVTYAGNMGIMHPLDAVFEAAALLQDEPVHFVFLGHGVRRPEWEELARDRGLGNVSFLSYLPQEDFDRLLATSDVAVVALKPGMERYSVPARAFTLLSMGTPLITVMEDGADVADIVTTGRCGWNAKSATEFATVIESLVANPEELAASSAHARDLYSQRFSREAGIQRYLDLITELAA